MIGNSIGGIKNHHVAKNDFIASAKFFLALISMHCLLSTRIAHEQFDF